VERISPLDWRTAGPEHRAALQSFTCADPPRAVWDRHRREKIHERPWELTVQSHIRALRPTLPSSENALLGFVDGDLASVVHFGWTDDGTQLLVLAIATEHEHRRAGLGRATLATTLDVLRSVRDEAAIGCGAFARIDRRNTPSARLFTAAGFVRLEPDREDTDLDYWVHDLL